MGDLLGAIAQYGIVPVVVGVILYLLIFWQNKRAESKRKKDENAAKLAENEQQIRAEQQRTHQELEFEAKIIGMIKDIMEPVHTTEEQNQSRHINTFIVKQLECLVEKGADRSYMFQFHNGGKDMLGRGFLKMSMMQEAIGQDIKSIMVKYQNAPRMMFPKLYDALDTNNYYDIPNVENIKDKDPFTYQFMIEHGVKSALFRSIKREDGLMIGFIGMEYMTKECHDMKEAGKLIDKKVNRIIGAMLGHEN